MNTIRLVNGLDPDQDGHSVVHDLGPYFLQRLPAGDANDYRAYPGSEFVVAIFLAKWKKLEPNEIGFSQKVVSGNCSVFNSLPASGDFCHLLIAFANSLDPDQARQNVRPDLDPHCLTP